MQVRRQGFRWGAVLALTLALSVVAPAASADHEDDGLDRQPSLADHLHDLSAALADHDASVSGMVVSDGPSADVIKNLAPAGRGTRLGPDATTDVWSHNGFAYTGTFNAPCGGEPDAGVFIWDVHNRNKVTQAGFIPSPTGSRSNDVKVASMNSGDVLVHSNESCAGGPGGFEIYNVDDPTNPVHLAHVGPIDEINPISNALFGGVTDVGVHNLFLFTQGSRDYVTAVAGSAFDNFRIWDITDPSSPSMIAAWGAEEVFDPGVGDETSNVGRVLNAALWLISGFGDSQNRFLHDITVDAAGTKAYLSNWDAGLILLDVSDPSDPQLVSVALDPSADLDGEVDSHAAWPTEDGSAVVETNEDFAFGQLAITVNSGPLGAGTQFGGTEDVNGAPPPRFAETGAVTGELVFVGRLCIGDPVSNAAAVDPGDILVIRRGACAFSEKLLNAQALGAGAGVIANNVPGGPAIPNWTAPDPGITIPGLFVSTADGDAIEASPTGNNATIDADVFTNLTPWGGVRIWDYSDPANPVLASTFLTTNALNETGPPDPRGTYSVHNVIVEKGKAYISWYSDGVLVLDISDPYNPVEVARFHREGPEFEATNGGIQDVWGIYKERGRPWLYASDRNGGLYVLKELGKGTIGKK